MPLLKEVRVLAASIEATSGTLETLDAADSVFNAFDVTAQPGIEFIQRKGQGAFSYLPGVLAERIGTINFKTHLFGNGSATTPTWASTLLPMCGFVGSSDTYSPSSAAPGSNVKTGSLAVFENGVRKMLRGAVGNCKMIFPTGKLVMLEWTFMGAWQTVADVAVPAPTYPTIRPLRYAAGTITLGGSALYGHEMLEIDFGNTILMRHDPTAADGSGISTGLITGRRVTGRMNPESQLVATHDVYGGWLAGTEYALSIALTDSTDTITIAAPKLQRTNVQEGDRSGLQIDDIEFQCNRSAAAGNDELTIDFS